MEADVLKTIGENTRKYRTRAGLTQAELAEKVGVGTSFISRVERGQKRRQPTVWSQSAYAFVPVLPER